MKSIDAIVGEALESFIREKKKERPIHRRFRYPISQDETVQLLTEAYRVEVEKRQRAFSLTSDTKAQINAVAEWLTNPNRKSSLLLYGRPGTGKTTMALAIQTMAKWLRDCYGSTGRERRQREQQKFYPPEVVSQFEKMASAVAIPTYTTALDVAGYAKDHRDKFDQLCDLSFLIVDDIGPEPRRVSDYGTEYYPIAELIQRRYNRLLHTVITTNLGDAEIEGTPQLPGYGRRIMDRLNEMCDKIPYGSSSFRR